MPVLKNPTASTQNPTASLFKKAQCRRTWQGRDPGLPVVTLHSPFRLIVRHSVDAPVHVFVDIITFELHYFPALIRSAAHMRRSPDSVILP
jgi:hypothetical protein